MWWMLSQRHNYHHSKKRLPLKLRNICVYMLCGVSDRGGHSIHMFRSLPLQVMERHTDLIEIHSLVRIRGEAGLIPSNQSHSHQRKHLRSTMSNAIRQDHSRIHIQSMYSNWLHSHIFPFLLLKRCRWWRAHQIVWELIVRDNSLHQYTLLLQIWMLNRS